MCKFDSSYLLLCYTRFSPLAIEISCTILSILGGIITYFGSEIIPFHIDANIFKIFFLINIAYFIIIIIFNILFIFFRYYDLMNNELYIWGYALSIVEIYIALFGLITNLIDDSLILTNMKYYQENVSKKNTSKYPIITSAEWLTTKIILFIIIFIWANILLMTITDNFLINLKIEASYHNYELALEDEKKFTDKQNKKEQTDSSNDNKDTFEINVNNKINKKNKESNRNKDINKNDIKQEESEKIRNINNYINNNININIKIDDKIQKRNLISSINALLTKNTLHEELKTNEENKN